MALLLPKSIEAWDSDLDDGFGDDDDEYDYNGDSDDGDGDYSGLVTKLAVVKGNRS